MTYAGAPVTLVRVSAAGLVFSTAAGGPPMLGVPDATGAIRESWALPDVLTLEPSPSGARAAWLTDDRGREPKGEDGWSGTYSSVTVETSTARPRPAGSTCPRVPTCAPCGGRTRRRCC